MGVDLMTYRCRVGSFVSCLSAGDKQKAGDGQKAAFRRGAANGQDPDEMFLFGNFSRLIKLIRSLTFIGMLIMLVIVSNPDPPDINMGVDITTYRCRDGMFVPGGGCGFMSLFITFGRVVNLLGSLTLVRILLLMAGVEPNPGPADKYIFRYQYLLVEIGTAVMRKVFDFQVGHDFIKHLSANNNKFGDELQSLIKKKIITADQAQYLPLIDMSPKSANFDITLLMCLLRNICGLPHHKPEWWKNPPSADFSLEADLARLRECRNNNTNVVNSLKLKCLVGSVTSESGQVDVLLVLVSGKNRPEKENMLILQHSGTVFISEADLTDKWKELSQILIRLNTVCGIPNLSSLIKDAEGMDTDQELKKRHDQTIKAWTNMDKLLDHDIEDLKLGQSEIKHGQSEIKHGLDKIIQGQSNLNVGQTEMKKSLDNIEKCQRELAEQMQKTSNTQGTKRQNIEQTPLDCKRKRLDKKELDLRDHLVKIYKDNYCTLPVSPLCEEDEDEDILSIYQPPSLYHVPYHRTQEKEEKYSISSYKELFCKDDHTFRKIYITGDAGVGKTSFCKHMTLLWCKSQCGESVSDASVQNDIDFMAKFDFVFYVSLRDTRRKDVLMMIVEQLFDYENEHKQKEACDCVENILGTNECIIIMDALDEWTPAESGKINIKKLLPDKCSFVTTCRPYKIENERLWSRDIDRQVQITGIKESSSGCYIVKIFYHINRANVVNLEQYVTNFVHDIKKCGLAGQLCIPIITSHLVAISFDHKLTDMSRALIYSNIVDMLLKRAEKTKGIELPSSAESKIHFPDSLSELFYFKKHISFLKKICLLSFNLLFQQDKCLSELVFTAEQLQSEPYCISANEMDFMCKFGILSKSKVIGGYRKQMQKLSYLHKSYLEYFAALFVSSFDLDNIFDNIVQKWTTINNVVQFENFFVFFVGLSIHKSKSLFENMYRTISDDLSLCRINAQFHSNSYLYSTQIKSLQTMVINCFKEVSGSNDQNISCKLEDFIFYDYSTAHSNTLNVDHLKQILLLNTSCVKSLHSFNGKYYSEFDQIQNLQCLHVGGVLSSNVYDVKFTDFMLQNQSTLHTVCIKGIPATFSKPEFPVRSLKHLTSLSLIDFTMHYNNLHDLLNFLSDNVLIENIKLESVYCDNHPRDSNCTLTLNLQHHTKLASLSLVLVNILCNNVNNSSLKSITLVPLSEMIVSCCIDVFNCIKDSRIEYLHMDGHNMLDNNTMKTLADTVKTLPCIKDLTVRYMKLPDDVLLQLHPDVTQVNIELFQVTMSPRCFHCFIECFVNYKTVIKVTLLRCMITSIIIDGETHKEMWDSVDYMSEYLTSIPTVNITHTVKGGALLQFERASCQ